MYVDSTVLTKHLLARIKVEFQNFTDKQTMPVQNRFYWPNSKSTDHGLVDQCLFWSNIQSHKPCIPLKRHADGRQSTSSLLKFSSSFSTSTGLNSFFEGVISGLGFSVKNYQNNNCISIDNEPISELITQQQSQKRVFLASRSQSRWQCHWPCSHLKGFYNIQYEWQKYEVFISLMVQNMGKFNTKNLEFCSPSTVHMHK